MMIRTITKQWVFLMVSLVWRTVLVIAATGLGGLNGASLVYAADADPSTSTYDFPEVVEGFNGLACPGTRSGRNLSCTAGEFASATDLRAAPGTPPFCVAGSSFDFLVDLQLSDNNAERYDVVFYVSEEGKDPRLNDPSNSCSVATLPTSPLSSLFPLDLTSPFANIDFDDCGDFVARGDGTIQIERIKVPCVPASETEPTLSIPYVLAWDVREVNNCSLPLTDAIPEGPGNSKCQMVGDASVSGDIPVYVGGYVDVTKTTNTGEDGPFTFTASGPAGTHVVAVVSADSLDAQGETAATYSPGEGETITNQVTVDINHGDTVRFYIDFPLNTTNELTITEEHEVGWKPEADIQCQPVDTGLLGSPQVDIDEANRTLVAHLNQQNAALKCEVVNERPTAGPMSGWVFEDNGAGGATAHDGQKEAGESGFPGVPVILFHDTDGDGVCMDSAPVLAATETDGGGAWLLIADSAHIGKDACLVVDTPHGYRSISEDTGTAGTVIDSAAVDDDLMILQVPPSNSVWDNILFGDAGLPILEPDQQGVVAPGGSRFYSHRFTARSAGSVDFALETPTTSPAAPAWNDILYRDDNCNGELDGADASLPLTAVTVQAGDSLCLLVKVFAPADAPLEALHGRPLAAAQSYTGTAFQAEARVTDTTRVAVGQLLLEKQVRNIGPDGVADTGDDVDVADTMANQAAPGDVLRYRLTFRNQGSNALTEVIITDSTPAYSALNAAAACPASLPATLTACALSVPDGSNGNGYQGSLEWQFTGELQPGGQGAVSYDVRVGQD